MVLFNKIDVICFMLLLMLILTVMIYVLTLIIIISMISKVLLTINAISEDCVLGAASIILIDLIIMCKFLIPYFPANKPTQQISRGQFLALKMRVFPYYCLISLIRKFR